MVFSKLVRTISAYQRGHRFLPLPILWEDITTKQKLYPRTSSKSVVTIIPGTQCIFSGNYLFGNKPHDNGVASLLSLIFLPILT